MFLLLKSQRNSEFTKIHAFLHKYNINVHVSHSATCMYICVSVRRSSSIIVLALSGAITARHSKSCVGILSESNSFYISSYNKSFDKSSLFPKTIQGGGLQLK